MLLKLELIFSILFQRTDGRVEVIIMLSQLLDVVVVEVGVEIGNTKDDLLWKMSFGGRQPLVEDKLRW